MEVARRLADAPIELTVLDRQNHQSFQPLLYQVATATLTPADIAWPIRTLLRGQRNARVLMAEVNGVDLSRRIVLTSAGAYAYDVLVIATGATHAYFGHPEWAPLAPGLKRIEDAIEIRRRLLCAYERAESAPSESERKDLTTFVVVGGGPTGVELAGAISDMARLALPPDFRNVDPSRSRVMLIEAGPRILPSFPADLSAVARKALEHRGVEVLTGFRVTDIDTSGVSLGETRITAGAVVWAAGVAASAAADWLRAEADRAGRVKVAADLSLPGRPEVFVIGDTALAGAKDGAPVPGIAPAAKQMGAYVAAVISARARGERPPPPFSYRHEGDLATIGRNSAIVHRGRLTLTGFAGWLVWSVSHIYFLIGTRNRIAVAFSWVWDYLTLSRRSRLITEPATRLAGGTEDAALWAPPAASDHAGPPGSPVWS
jgi:NADH dehydrogenase